MFKVSTQILFFTLASAAIGYGQNISGSISGRAVDQQGSAVAGASVTVTEPDKNVTVTLKTNEQGEFTAAGLMPGLYTVAVEAQGFKKLSRPRVNLDAADKLALGNLELSVGSVTESIEISGQASLLQTESVERSATISAKQIENIEVNGRNPLDLVKLVPGVVDTSSFAVGGLGGLGGIQVNGNRGSMNQLTINGIGDIDTGANNSQNVSVSLDSMQEFKILTGTYQAEYGRNAGAQISMVTKSGTDAFHGSGYWYHRHDGLNANTFINNVRGLPRNLYRYNDPGYTIGGPAYIPKILPWTKNKVFFFFSEEYQEQLQPNSAKNVTVPTALERLGNFSQSVDNNNKTAYHRDPNTQIPFAGNMIPKSQLYAPGVALLNIYPLPNAVGTGYNYSSQFSGKQPRREDLLRMDYNLSSNIRVFGHWIQNAQSNVLPYGSFVLGPTVPITNISDPPRGTASPVESRGS